MIEINNTTKHELPIVAEEVKLWVVDQCSKKSIDICSLGVIFLSDDELLEMNKKHLDHDYYTDILSFDYSEEPTLIDGELYISIDRVVDNSEQLQVGFKEELLRVIAHGVLHLTGMNDSNLEEKQKMREEEDFWIEAFNVSRGTSVK